MLLLLIVVALVVCGVVFHLAGLWIAGAVIGGILAVIFFCATLAAFYAARAIAKETQKPVQLRRPTPIRHRREWR